MEKKKKAVKGKNPMTMLSYLFQWRDKHNPKQKYTVTWSPTIFVIQCEKGRTPSNTK